MSTTGGQELEDANEVEANATGDSIVGYVWPTISMEVCYFFSILVSSLILIILTVIIAEKCLNQKLAGTAEHAFYCTVSQVFCMGEALILRNLTIHTLFGLVALCVGFPGIIIQTWLQSSRNRRNRLLCCSTHGVFGLVGSLFILGCFVSGMWMFLQQLSQPTFNYMQLGHRVCGLLGFMACMCSQIYSYNTDFVLCNWKTQHVALIKCATIMATITASTLAFKCLFEDITSQIPIAVFRAINIEKQ